MKKKHISMILVLCMALMMVLVACGQPAATQAPTEAPSKTEAPAASDGGNAEIDPNLPDEFLLGCVSPLTAGSYAFGSNEVKNAIELAVEKQGTLLGKPIVFECGDAADNEQTMSEFERLYGKGVRYFMGSYGSFCDLTIQKVVDQKGCIYIAAAGWADNYTDQKIKNFFHFTPNVSRFCKNQAVPTMLEYGEKYLGKKKEDLKIAMVWASKYEYVATAAGEAFKDNGITLAYEEGYDENRKDFTPLVQKLKDLQIDILAPAQGSSDGPAFLKKLREMKYDIPMIFGFGLFYDQPDAGKLGADIIDGCLAMSYTHPMINTAAAPGLEEFKNKYMEKHGWYPLTHATQTYAGTQFLFMMIEKAGTFDVEKVQPIIESADIPAGVLPNYWGVQFAEDHKNMRAGEPFVTGQWQNAELVVVGPDVLKTHDAIIPWDASKLK